MGMLTLGVKDCLDGNACDAYRLVRWRFYGLLFGGNQPIG